jgi:hypothetical protein
LAEGIRVLNNENKSRLVKILWNVAAWKMGKIILNHIKIKNKIKII